MSEWANEETQCQYDFMAVPAAVVLGGAGCFLLRAGTLRMSLVRASAPM